MLGPKRSAMFRFYGELDDFLPAARRGTAFRHFFDLSPSVKDLVESLGVPHTEIDLILVNTHPVDFAYSVQNGDWISAYPAFRSWDMGAVMPLRLPLGEHCFVLDTHLGRLATYLRMLGFDTLYRNHCDDDELARISRQQGRVLLTRDRGLLKRSEVIYGYYVRSTEAKEQAGEVVSRFSLAPRIEPFRRCLRCNTLLLEIAKESVFDRLPARTREQYDAFRICATCDRIYWPGSHYEHMITLIRAISERQARSAPRS